MEIEHRPKFINLKFSDRDCINKVLYCVYKGLNLFYTSIYYYFMPFLSQLAIIALLLIQNSTTAQKGATMEVPSP